MSRDSQLDGDLQWLLTHVPKPTSPNIHKARVESIQHLINQLIKQERLPYTVGLFGTWGAGKTTFLALLAQELSSSKVVQSPCKVVYFNAWKYAGFMEIVPSLIYKVLKYGCSSKHDVGKTIAQIMISLGKEYSDKFGEWFEDRFGVNPIKFIEDVQTIKDVVEGELGQYDKLLDTYYTQIDRAQDLLKEAFENSDHTTIILIDELDRCDPDEAFAVIKQLRVFFAMRSIPVLFVLCANPEPIGLAIKHRYGLDSPLSDYEARKILEKFVDTYVDLSEPLRLDALVESLWKDVGKNVITSSAINFVDKFVKTNLNVDTVKNSTSLQAINTGNIIYSNLRLLKKSLDYVCSRQFSNNHLLWCAWHLEIIEQIDPVFRRDISHLASYIQQITVQSYYILWQTKFHWLPQENKIILETDKGGSLFGIFRSLYWDNTKKCLEDLSEREDPESENIKKTLKSWLSDYRRMDFIILMSLLPVPDNLLLRFTEKRLDNFNEIASKHSQEYVRQFGWLLANY